MESKQANTVRIKSEKKSHILFYKQKGSMKISIPSQSPVEVGCMCKCQNHSFYELKKKLGNHRHAIQNNSLSQN